MDGMAAAWIARINLFKDRLSDNVIPIPAHYGSAFPIDNVESGDIVYILDFSYPREIMIDIANKCNVILLDHHESAIKDLVGIDKVAPGHFYFLKLILVLEWHGNILMEILDVRISLEW